MPDLGKKYECAECGTKFYDLGKSEPICPKCGTNQRGLQEPQKTVAPAPRTRAAAPPPVAPPTEVAEDELPADIGDEDEEILEVMPGEEEEEEEEDDEG
jgi:predicted  nucleic acid-binding Zn-ribbon protein